MKTRNIFEKLYFWVLGRRAVAGGGKSPLGVIFDIFDPIDCK